MPARILIVEDDAPLRRLIGLALEHAGHEVVVALDQATALECLEWFEPNLILLDLQLPDGTGAEVARQYHQRSNRSAPILVVTAVPIAEAELDAIDPVGVFPKPFRFRDLLDLVHRLVGMPTRGARPELIAVG